MSETFTLLSYIQPFTFYLAWFLLPQMWLFQDHSITLVVHHSCWFMLSFVFVLPVLF